VGLRPDGHCGGGVVGAEETASGTTTAEMGFQSAAARSRQDMRAASTKTARSVRLETNRSLVEAIALFRASGYVEVPAFNDEPHAHLWFEKRL
jgi:hypothetical protein